MEKTVNARVEFEEHLAEVEDKVILAAYLKHDRNDGTLKSYYLKIGFDEQAYQVFLDEIDKLVYDAGFGQQELYGEIFWTDGTWSERQEYDGSEWWALVEKPTIPEGCLTRPQ